MKNKLLHLAVAALLLTVGLSLAYYSGYRRAMLANDGASDELEALRTGQNDAAIVQRVSQQMEDIAYQQKAVSDQERDRAKQQSELAMAMRDRAEQESRLAREAERKANDAAIEAQQQREAAMLHQKTAEEQRDQANYAKSVTDTLNYRALGRTLGSSSYIQHESGNVDLAIKLAYSSWYLLDHFGGNTYHSETFSALSLCSNTQALISTKKGGAVRALHPLYGLGCVTVTDYGEMEIYRKMGVRRSVVMQDDRYDFRDVWADSTNIFALSFHGPLCKTDFKKLVQEIALPEGDYLKLLDIGDNRFLVAAKRHILILDRLTGNVIQRKDLDRELSALTQDHHGICMFFTDGSACRMDSRLSMVPLDVNGNRVITAACYNDRLKLLVLGCINGNMLLVNTDDRVIATAMNHVGRITDVVIVGDIMMSASYDKNVFIWNLPALRVNDSETLSQALGLPDGVMNISKSGIANEWLTPVAIKCDTWPLALCQFSDNEIAVGTAGSMVARYNVSTSDMARQLKENYDVSLSREDWEHYIGSTVPYIELGK